MQITGVTPDDYLNERRISIVTCYDGTIKGVFPENSSIFGFPASVLKGLHITDLIDIFSEWNERTGSRDIQLLLLALLDREDDMPGGCACGKGGSGGVPS